MVATHPHIPPPPPLAQGGGVIGEAACGDGGADAVHEFLVVMQVMLCQQHRSQHFIGLEQVMQIGAGIAVDG